MKTKILPFFFLTVMLISCNKSGIYSKFDKLAEDNRWTTSDAKTFEFDIADETQSYDILFQISHVYGYQFANVPINFSMESPDGKKEDFVMDLPIKDSKGKDLGDCSGDICDLVTVVKKKIKLQKGHYKISVSNSFKGPYLPNIIGIGLEVNKAK